MTTPTPEPALVVLVGATASGKSQLAVDLALASTAAGCPAEIVNADSMAVYRGMNIGTAKPSPEQLAQVPHHLIDIYDLHTHASVAEFQGLARHTIAELRGRGVRPIVVGGSALYTHAIVDELTFPGTDPQVRLRWQQRCDQIGAEALHAELAQNWPEVAAEILPQNGRRIVRALEVLELTGTFTPTLPEPRYALSRVFQFGIELPREQLDARIADRVAQMWQAGFVAEVEQLADRGLRDAVTASRALGYRQVLQQLAGELSADDAREQTITQTRRFARKQLGWFRRDQRICWLSAGDDGNLSRILECIGQSQPR